MEGQRGPNKSDIMEEDRREQSEQSSDQVKFCKNDHWVLILIIFFLSEE